MINDANKKHHKGESRKGKPEKLKSRADLILHPVRLRILSTLSGGSFTPLQLGKKMPDIPQATLYRHLKRLEKGGIILVAESRPVRGTLEKVYALKNPEEANLSAEDMRYITSRDHQRYFTAFIAGILKHFFNVTSSIPEDPEIVNKIGYHTHPLLLDPKQLPELSRELTELLGKYARKTDRRENTERGEAFNLTTIFLPEVKDES